MDEPVPSAGPESSRAGAGRLEKRSAPTTDGDRPDAAGLAAAAFRGLGVIPAHGGTHRRSCRPRGRHSESGRVLDVGLPRCRTRPTQRTTPMLSIATLVVVPGVLAPPDPYVLLVDDHEPSLRAPRPGGRGSRGIAACRRTLRHRGAALLRRDPSPSVVVTDLSMPNLDGHGPGRWLQARHPSAPDHPDDGPGLRRAVARPRCGASSPAMLAKPVDVERFLDLPRSPHAARGQSRPGPRRSLTAPTRCGLTMPGSW